MRGIWENRKRIGKCLKFNKSIIREKYLKTILTLNKYNKSGAPSQVRPMKSVIPTKKIHQKKTNLELAEENGVGPGIEWAREKN